ncbi:hypothetical protein FNF27_05622 [Cafeteria roenbergensis]|uniref:Phosphatidylinositol-3,4,5-trisphosphate 3-phosphatase n=2 Tax=Cafeteria roenbergensis TaxID=33653 RepID=A0A5A8DLZ9_CAFRO|nr:hypothetical protein FNF29_04834 [Cafeteria roenbergensis]KAA0164891.1 hypothetical protein FNF31_02214 [Cafeteria roenbergensis]KAA0172868.1 hypothetical protein FNF27_05622 [Cafeteria roenbergensis]|eukprot:KAA0151142.1 hypothetical protein FNF29_04834 [Cafeteria roenbergensis]
MALAFIRGLTSGRRRRLVDADSGFDLDLTYITSRIVAMGYPSTGIEAAYRNSAADVARFLRGRHAGNYLLLNLSERPYDESEFDHRVMNVGFPDHHPPPWELLWTITISLDRWLRADPANVVVVHCQAGKGRTGTVIAAALLMRQWFSLAPIDRLVGPELATGLDAMAGALHEDKGTPGRADVEKGAALPELWANGRVPGDGTTSEAFPRGPPWALPALTLPPGAASSEALSKLAGPQAGPGVAPGMLVLRPPTVAARAALRLFWARRGEGVTYPGQARSVAGVAALCWRAVARAVWRRRVAGRAAESAAAAGAGGEASSEAPPAGGGSDSGSSPTTAAAAPSPAAVPPAAGTAEPDAAAAAAEGAARPGAGSTAADTDRAAADADEDAALDEWLAAASAASLAGDSFGGAVLPVPDARPHEGAEADAVADDRMEPAAWLASVGPSGLRFAPEMQRWPMLLVRPGAEAEAVTGEALDWLRRYVPPESPPFTITQVVMPVPPTLPASLGGGASSEARLCLVIEQTPHESARGRALFSTLWDGPHAGPVVRTGAAGVINAATAVAEAMAAKAAARLPGVVVSGDVTLRLFAAADSGPTAAIGRQVEVYRTTLHTGMLRQMERSSTLVVRTPRGLDMDARKERLRGLAPSARPGTATWLPRRFRLVVHLAPGSKAAAAAELARADYRAGMGRERVADGPTSFPAAPPRAAAAAAGTARSPSATAAPDAVGGTVSASSSRQLTEDERAHALSMEGWVWKRGDLNRTWRRRWLVLRHRSLVYHKEAAGAPAGAVPLSECLRVDAVAREEADGRDFVFAVDTKQRRWLLQAESEEEAAAWLAVLGQAWASLRVPLSKRS